MMDLASGVTKAITELLEQNEKRFISQQTAQEAQAKLLEGLQTKVDALETKCIQLIGENTTLKEDLKKSKQREEESAKEITQLKSDVEKLQKGLKDFNSWIKLITAIAEQIESLNSFRVDNEDKMKEILDNQSDISKQNRRLQQQLVANSLRTPVKSPSTSSFLNGNIHSSLPRIRSHKYNNDNHYVDTLEQDSISEIEADAVRLKNEVDALKKIHESFEKSSIYSDD